MTIVAETVAARLADAVITAILTNIGRDTVITNIDQWAKEGDDLSTILGKMKALAKTTEGRAQRDVDSL